MAGIENDDSLSVEKIFLKKTESPIFDMLDIKIKRYHREKKENILCF